MRYVSAFCSGFCAVDCQTVQQNAVQIKSTMFQLMPLKCKKWLYCHNEAFFKTQDWPAIVTLLKALGIQQMSWLDSVKVLVYTVFSSIWLHPDAVALSDLWVYMIHIWFLLDPSEEMTKHLLFIINKTGDYFRIDMCQLALLCGAFWQL